MKTIIILPYLASTDVTCSSFCRLAARRASTLQLRLHTNIISIKSALKSNNTHDRHHFNGRFHTYLNPVVTKCVWRELVVHKRVTQGGMLRLSARG